MQSKETASLSYDPIHGYIRFVGDTDQRDEETTERHIIDHPWLQRMRQIHQLQTAWWVFPTAEHTRFQHVLGAMHLGSRAAVELYDSLRQVCEEDGEQVPSRGYVESLLRLAGLLHDVGHGPFGHFFDAHYLTQYGLTHETLGAAIIQHELGEAIRGVRRNPNSCLEPHETLDPAQIAWLIQRPSTEQDEPNQPLWLCFLRSLLSGIYTIDNMDFVLRDAYMSGYSPRAYDLDRLLHYSFFSSRGLTIADRGMDSLMRFMAARAELFRTVYFHRTVRAIDLALADVFADSKEYLFPGNPLQHLDEYLHFTESSLLVDVARWTRSKDTRKRAVGARWQQILRRQVPWRMACQRGLLFSEDDSESSSIFSDALLVEGQIRKVLPPPLQKLPLKVDIARHIYRPHTRGPAARQNFLYDSGPDRIRPLSDHQLFRHLPVSHRICRVYTTSCQHSTEIARAVDSLIGSNQQDDLTNM